MPLRRFRLNCWTIFESFSCLATLRKSEVEMTDFIRFLFNPLHLVIAGEDSLSTSMYILTDVARNISICRFLISDLI